MTHGRQPLSPLKKRVTILLAAALIEALLFLLSSPLAELGAGALCALFHSPLEGTLYPILVEILYMLLYALTFLLPALLAVKLLGGTRRDYIPLTPRFACSPTLAAAVTLGCLTAASYLSNLYLSLLDLCGIGIYYSESPFPDGGAAILLYFLSSVVVPAFVEEIAYRGVVLHALRPFGRWFAIIASGVLFGVMHFNPSQFLYAAAAGIALAYFVLESGSLWLSIALHALNNALSFFGHWLYDCLSPSAYTAFFTILDALTVAAAAIGILTILYRRCKLRRYEERPSPSMREALSAFLSPVGAAYAAVALFLSAQWCYFF